MAKIEETTEGGWLFECPGCRESHEFNVTPGSNGVGSQLPVWNFNGNLDAPTFTPSLLVRWDFGVKREPKVCHSFVTDGMIQFLSDCTHHLAGQTVLLADV